MFEGLLNASNHRFAHTVGIAKTDFAFCRMHIYIDSRRIDLNKKEGNRILPFHKSCVVALTHGSSDNIVFNRSSVDEYELLAAGLPAKTCLTDKPTDLNFRRSSDVHFNQALQQLHAVQVAYPITECCGRRQLKQDPIVAHQREANLRMTDRLQMNLMFDVAAFGILRTKKFPARWQIIKKRSHFDLRAWRFTAVPHNVDFAAVNNNLCPGDCARFTCTHPESRHTGNARQGFAAKPQRRDCLKISSRTNLAGRMSLERKQRVIAVHATAIIDHANQRNSAATNSDIDTASTGVETVFNKFFHD